MGGTFLKQKPFGAIFNTLKTNTMIKEIVLTSEAHDQQARLSGRPLSTLNENELFELILIMYQEYNHEFITTTDWKDKVLKDRADSLTDKQDSFSQDLDPDES